MIISSIIIILTISYCWYSIHKKGSLPKSLLETFYILNPLIFALFCNIIGILLIPSLLNVTEEKYQFIPFIACISFIFCNNYPLYKEKVIKEEYYTFEILAFVLFIVYICMFYPFWIIPYIIVLIAAYFNKKESIVFLLEIAAILLLAIIFKL